jgi:hypothetical protein
MHYENKTELECNTCNKDLLLESPRWKDKRIAIIITSVITLSIGMVFELLYRELLTAEFLFLITSIISGYNIAKDGFTSLFYKKG